MNTLIELANGWGARYTAFAASMFWQSAVLIALLIGLDLALRKRAPATLRYLIWMLALVKLALPPSLALPTGAAYWLPRETTGRYAAPISDSNSPALAVEVQTAVHAPSVPARAVENTNAAVPTIKLRPAGFFFLVWLAVAVGMALWVAWRWGIVAGIIGQSEEAPEEARALLESCCRQLCVKRTISLRCAAIGSPAICGVWRPVILIPPGLTQNLTGAEMRSVLLHELAHYKRGDLWVNHAQTLLQILYWYNPLLWLANGSIRRAREQAVDERVLVEMGRDAQGYPAMLLQVARLGLGRPWAAVGLMGMLEPGGGLTRRIKHIMNCPLPRSARIGFGGMAAVLLLGLVALPMASGRNKQQEIVVVVSEQGTMMLQNEPVMADDLAEKLAQAARANPGAALAIQADRHAPWTDVVKVMDAAKAAHIDRVTAHVNQPSVAAGPQFTLPRRLIPPKPIMPPNPIMNRAAYDEGKALWLKRVEDDPTNTTILNQAAQYLLLYDRAEAEALLKKGQTLEPENPAWSSQLGHLYVLNSHTADTASNAAKALAEFEKAHQHAAPGSPDLADMAKTAFAAGDLDKARKYANELLGPGLRWAGGGDAGDATFQGNIVLGRIAVREGKLEEANQYLTKAGQTTGSPVLGSFGPSMSLAADLLENGQTNAVLEFFKECGQFWKMGGEKLTAWTKTVQDGGTPNFGSNLDY